MNDVSYTSNTLILLHKSTFTKVLTFTNSGIKIYKVSYSDHCLSLGYIR